MIAFASASPDPFRDQQPLADFSALALADKPPNSATVRNAAIAVAHFGRYLRRPAVVADLTSEAIERLGAWLVQLGKARGTAEKNAAALVSLGTLAAAGGLIDVAPCHQRDRYGRRGVPFSLEELERILAAALQSPGDVAGVPANLWWPAFVLTSINTQLSAVGLLDLARNSFLNDPRQARLRAGGLVFSLHPATAEALAKLAAAGQPGRAALFPWPGNAKKRIDMLLYHFRLLLDAAVVPSQRGAAFARLSLSIAAHGTLVLDRLDAARIERERRALTERRRAADRRRAEHDRVRRRECQATVPPRNRRGKEARRVYPLRHNTERSLRTFFRAVYAPLRLAASASPATAAQYEGAINMLAYFTGCEVTLDQLSADFVDRFSAWHVASGRGGPHSTNRHTRAILALWRYAIRKRQLPPTAEPDLVERLRTPKREPKTWTLDEFELLLGHASRLTGEVDGVPIASLLPAVLLTLFYTGLRIGALLRLRVTDLRADGWLLVPAEFQKHASDQAFKLPADALDAIAATRPATRVILFGGPPEGATWLQMQARANRLRKILKRALTAAGLPTDAKSCFHNVRRLSATQIVIVAGDAAATSHLGHSTPSLLKHYVDRTQLQKPRAAELLPRPRYNAPPSPPPPPAA